MVAPDMYLICAVPLHKNKPYCNRVGISPVSSARDRFFTDHLETETLTGDHCLVDEILETFF